MVIEQVSQESHCLVKTLVIEETNRGNNANTSAERRRRFEMESDATFYSYHGSNRYGFEVTAEQLANCPAWLEGEDNPPLPARRAIEIATNYLSKLFPDAEKWRMDGFSVLPVGEKWVYRVQFTEPLPEHASEHLTTGFSIVVLMNGEVGRVKVSPWKPS